MRRRNLTGATRTPRRIARGVLIGLYACSPELEFERAPVQARRQVPPLPTFAFQAPAPWRSRHADSAAVDPPDLAQETWRVLVTQDEPMQRKTPTWQPARATETIELQLPPNSRFRCIVPPLEIESQANEFGTALEAWSLARSFLCSNDDFHTWSETILRVRITRDGAREVGPEAGILLRERQQAAGAPHHMFVLMRSDREQREATLGPPQIIVRPGPKDLD